MYFGKNIKYLRRKAGLQQDQMLAFTGITRATWSDYERENTQPRFDALILISKHFGVAIDELITKDIEKENENVHLNENLVAENDAEYVHLNVHPNVHLNKNASKVEAKLLQEIAALKERIMVIQEQLIKEKEEKFQLMKDVNSLQKFEQQKPSKVSINTGRESKSA